MSEQSDGSAAQPALATSLGVTMFFPVSTLKLVLMSLCTVGLYQLFWFYNNWTLLRERRESNGSPIWRAIFAILFCYPLFDRIRLKARSHDIATSLPAGPLAAGWIVFTLCARLPDPAFLLWPLSIACLVPVQKTVNAINAVTDPEHDPNARFSGWNIAALIIGGLLWLLALIGLFAPAK